MILRTSYHSLRKGPKAKTSAAASRDGLGVRLPRRWEKATRQGVPVEPAAGWDRTTYNANDQSKDFGSPHPPRAQSDEAEGLFSG